MSRRYKPAEKPIRLRLVLREGYKPTCLGVPELQIESHEKIGALAEKQQDDISTWLIGPGDNVLPVPLPDFPDEFQDGRKKMPFLFDHVDNRQRSFLDNFLPRSETMVDSDSFGNTAIYVYNSEADGYELKSADLKFGGTLEFDGPPLNEVPIWWYKKGNNGNVLEYMVFTSEDRQPENTSVQSFMLSKDTVVNLAAALPPEFEEELMFKGFDDLWNIIMELRAATDAVKNMGDIGSIMENAMLCFDEDGLRFDAESASADGIMVRIILRPQKQETWKESIYNFFSSSNSKPSIIIKRGGNIYRYNRDEGGHFILDETLASNSNTEVMPKQIDKVETKDTADVKKRILEKLEKRLTPDTLYETIMETLKGNEYESEFSNLATFASLVSVLFALRAIGRKVNYDDLPIQGAAAVTTAATVTSALAWIIGMQGFENWYSAQRRL
jgi:hypothetical protein